ncbi:hypothetical protein HY405_01635 [Candidatus Microgenomates bacterium]|nr:hypothetical protein [Candidatus Microgenomates bacterium]
MGSELAGGRPNLHLVVLIPGSENILYEESFGQDRSTWRYPFDEIARAKARLCQRTCMVARNVQKDASWLYEEGDTRYVGGVIENGLVVAASELQDHLDEMISWMVLSVIQVLCRDFIARIDDDKAPDFFT